MHCPSSVCACCLARPTGAPDLPLRVPGDAVAHLPGQVQPLAVALEHVDDPQALLGVARSRRHQLVEHALAPVAERRVPEVVAEARSPRSGPRSGAATWRWCARSARPRACASAASGSGRPAGEKKTWVLCFSRRKALQWMMRSRSRWNAGRMSSSGSAGAARACRRCAPPAAPGTAAHALRVLRGWSWVVSADRRPRKLVPCASGPTPNTSASVCAEVGEGRRACRGPTPARTRGPVTSSGTYSREWSVLGVVGSLPWSAVSTSRSSGAQPRQQFRQPRVEPLEVGRVALDVVAVAVDACRSPRGWRRSGRATVDAIARSTSSIPSSSDVGVHGAGDAVAGEEVLDLADGERPGNPASFSRSSSVGCRRRHGEVVAVRRSAGTRPGLPTNGRAMMRPRPMPFTSIS